MCTVCDTLTIGEHAKVCGYGYAVQQMTAEANNEQNKLVQIVPKRKRI